MSRTHDTRGAKRHMACRKYRRYMRCARLRMARAKAEKRAKKALEVGRIHSAWIKKVPT